MQGKVWGTLGVGSVVVWGKAEQGEGSGLLISCFVSVARELPRSQRGLIPPLSGANLEHRRGGSSRALTATSTPRRPLGANPKPKPLPLAVQMDRNSAAEAAAATLPPLLRRDLLPEGAKSVVTEAALEPIGGSS